MSWVSQAAANILPLSYNKADLTVALSEWRYSGRFHDLETPSAHCELCDHPDIRYQFEIINLYSAAALLIGSECIHRFGIAATDEEGRTLGAEETRSKVEKDRRKLIEEARKKRVVLALVTLAHVDADFDIASFIDYLQTREAFTPKQLAILLWRLSKFEIRHEPRDFKLTIRRDREKAQLIKLPDWQLQRLAPCLSVAQRTYLANAGRQIP